MNGTRRDFLSGRGGPVARLWARRQRRKRKKRRKPCPIRNTRWRSIWRLCFPAPCPTRSAWEIAANCGAKHYAWWGWPDKPLDAMLKTFRRSRGLRCVSITGNPKTGWGSGLTKPGHEQEFLDDFARCCAVANQFGVDNLITFRWRGAERMSRRSSRRRKFVAGLKKAGDIARRTQSLSCS